MGEAIRPYHYFSLPVEEISYRTVVALSYTFTPGQAAQGLARRPESGGLSAFLIAGADRQELSLPNARWEESHL